MQFKYRDKIVVDHNGKYVEGFVLQVIEGEGLLYVVLNGQNQKPTLVSPKQCVLLSPESEQLLAVQIPKRKRGRPRKGT